jgi:hypothetical protein
MHATIPPTFTAIFMVALTVLALTIDHGHGALQFALGAGVGVVAAIAWERRATIPPMPPEIRQAIVPMPIAVFLWVAPTVLAAATWGDWQGAVLFVGGACLGALLAPLRPWWLRP